MAERVGFEPIAPRPRERSLQQNRPETYLQTNRAESSILPVPEYVATCGYGQTGRVRSTSPLVAPCDATICAGFLPLSTHCSSVVTASNTFGPTPPAQCCIPGIMNSRAKSSVSFVPIFFSTDVK